MSDFLKDLNEAQFLAANELEGPLMILAGAGSGKTRVLTYRIAHLMSHGVDPFNILALTFTNKAAKEMRERIEKIVGSESRNLWMGTFHSVFARILRAESGHLNYPYNFTIYDTIDAKSLLKTVIKEMELDDKIYKPNVIYNRISSAKNQLITAKEYSEDINITKEDHYMGRGKTAEIYLAYQMRCFKAGAMDFDDLLLKTYQLFESKPEILNKYQNIFQYILVDEYQDTNHAQYSIIQQLSNLYNNICVVGDDAQSIYSFRGANISNIINFKTDYKGAQILKLEQNYRSTKNIVGAANAIIKLNKQQIPKEVWTENPIGDKILVTKNKTDNDEGRYVAESIFENKMQNQLANSAFAVLYRTNAQSRAIEEALRKINLSYKIYGGISFYQRKEIKDLLSYFRVIINPNDEEALKRIINYPARGIGKTSLDKIFIIANQYNKSIWEVMANLNYYPTGLNNSAKSKFEDFVTQMVKFNSCLYNTTAYDLAHQISVETGILKDLNGDKTPEGIARYENIMELLSAIKQFTNIEERNQEGKIVNTLDKFMEDVALLTDADNEKEDDKDKISLMTIHAAKGLEFPYVYIVGLEENLFPSQMALNSREELEEERRLFYVALTRAEKMAYLSYAITRFKFGNVTYSDPSRFINEIPEQYVQQNHLIKNIPISNSYNSSPKRLSKISQIDNNITEKIIALPGNTNGDIQVGQKVAHLRFGKGIVENIEGIGANTKATINFENSGTKQVLIKFAKLKIIE
jgi:DNA helicase-2/ATP-dependent DNA helicase PcrA